MPHLAPCRQTPASAAVVLTEIRPVRLLSVAPAPVNGPGPEIFVSGCEWQFSSSLTCLHWLADGPCEVALCLITGLFGCSKKGHLERQGKCLCVALK